MKALVFHRPKKVNYETVPDPKIENKYDIILKVTSTSFTGTDLLLYNGLIPQARPIIMGHEFVGEVEATGPHITHLKNGDRVLVPSALACGHCYFCEHQLHHQCENSNANYGPEGGYLQQKGGAIFGLLSDIYGGLDGGAAKYVRVPYGNFGPRKIPSSLSDEKVLLITDTFATAYHALQKASLKGGETVVVFGCGPLGISCMKAAWLKGAGRVIAIDHLRYRLTMASKYAKAETIHFQEMDPVETIREMTLGRGADLCIDAVGMDADRNVFERVSNLAHLQAGTLNVLKTCVSTVRRGGIISILGHYGTTYDNFPLGQIFDKSIQLQTGMAPVHRYVDELIELVKNQKIILDDLISHTLPLSRGQEGLHLFASREDQCLKIILKP